MIRLAQPWDAAALARIYNQAMQPGLYATAQVEPDSAAERARWLARQRDPYGAWVIETAADEIAGWCALSPFAVRPRVTEIAEISVYVDKSQRSRAGGSFGGALLACLILEARRRGFRSLVSIVFEKNIASIAGCLLAGFRPMAVLRGVASCNDAHENVAWLQKDLQADDPPALVKHLQRIQGVLGPAERGSGERQA